MRSRVRLVVPAAMVLLAVAAPGAGAQVVTVDEGSFVIRLRGEPVGREEFRIRRTPVSEGAANFVASATLTWGDRRVAPDLRADDRGALLAYRVETRIGEGSPERLASTVDRGRYTARFSSALGESAREAFVRDGAVALEDSVFHQYYFVTWQGAGDVPVVLPRRAGRHVLRVEDRGREAVVIGAGPVDARHFIVRGHPDGLREVWVDDRNRVLRVALPASGLVATREEAPRP